MKASVIQGEIFNGCTPAAALALAQRVLRATKIKTPNIAGAAGAEYRGSHSGRSIENLSPVGHFDRIEVETVRFDIVGDRVRNQIVDRQEL